MQLRRGDVLDGAIAILDEYGLGDLTMRRLATSLGVQPGALYWHFPNKQTLLAAITDEMLTGVSAPIEAANWDARLRTVAHRMRDALLAHRDGAELAAASYAARLATNGAHATLASTCEAAGLPGNEAELAADTLLYYILGQTMDEQSRMQMDSHGALTEDASPLYDSTNGTARFDYGLSLFVDGVRSRLRATVRD
ncbi:TetR/AcrR family transcriptional regulator C-terminal domain-containing protein [Rhodococcus sp. UNC363MFTsu5.1]|uniref:TetR/AcrR family transcriptional regulator C-terminal domain-containing protein n=1 Tax=Rhodococcus sp. UNC363MFTsu5.1 TaxID=1449069 RepID=UPI0004845504|nr:TetR/AcrR family transcriptional regulator C-terminal domain-containing protein [Rhodococcus sp. UNC363MFTsu5.1]